MINWKLQTKKIKSLKPYSKNPRYITETDLKHLQVSIAKFGMIDKPIINLDGTIIGGHQRIGALKQNGTKEIECWVPERQLDEKEVEELNIRLNKNTGQFDFDILANEWETEDLLTWGFDEKEFGISAPEGVEEKEAKEEDKEKTIKCPKCGEEFVE